MRASIALVLVLGCSAHKTFDDAITSSGEGGTREGNDGSMPADPQGDIDTGVPETCPYPSGPYGIDQGSIVSPSMTWQGYKPNSSSVSTITMRDFFDCDGTKGVNAILVDTSAVWCGPCNQESAQLESVMQSQWGPAGVQVLLLMWQNVSRGPASMSDVTTWKSKYGLDMVNCALDTQFQFAHPNSSVSLPTNVLINPRTMKIEAIGKGYGGGPDPVVLKLANNNK
jgi:hypothetical protein